MRSKGDELKGYAKLKAIEGWVQEWTNHDVRRLLEHFTDNFVYEDVPTNRVLHGPAEFRQFTEEVFSAAPDVTYEVTHAFTSGAHGSAEWVLRGTHLGSMDGLPATGKKFEVRGSSVFEFEGDKIRRCSDYWSIATMLTQIGVMPG